MTFEELKRKFEDHESTSPEKHLIGHIIFTEDSFTRSYPEISRTFVLSSSSKDAYGRCLDGSGTAISIDGLIEAGMIVENCFVKWCTTDGYIRTEVLIPSQYEHRQ